MYRKHTVRYTEIFADAVQGFLARLDTQAPSLYAQHRTFGCGAVLVDKGHVWTVPAVQEEFDFSAKRSGAAMSLGAGTVHHIINGSEQVQQNPRPQA